MNQTEFHLVHNKNDASIIELPTSGDADVLNLLFFYIFTHTFFLLFEKKIQMFFDHLMLKKIDMNNPQKNSYPTYT